MKYALINGKILNGHQDMEVETGKAIFIENEKIVAIEPYRNLDKSYQIIDLQGKYILPGLINMHVHLAGNGKPQKKQRNRLHQRQEIILRFCSGFCLQGLEWLVLVAQ